MSKFVAGTNVPVPSGYICNRSKNFFICHLTKKSFKGIVLGTIMSISSNFEQNLTKESFFVTNGLIHVKCKLIFKNNFLCTVFSFNFLNSNVKKINVVNSKKLCVYLLNFFSFFLQELPWSNKKLFVWASKTSRLCTGRTSRKTKRK